MLGGAVNAAQLTFTAVQTWLDTNFKPSDQQTFTGTSNNTTAVTLATSVTASQKTGVEYLSVYNSDSANATVKLKIVSASGSVTIFQTVLVPGATLQYTVMKGWELLNPVDVSAAALDTLAPPTDNTTLNASTSKHGLCPKLDGDITHCLRGDGTWGPFVAS